MPASPVHHTATVDTTWDAGAATKGMSGQAELTYCHAWHEKGATDVKGDYKFPHHVHKGGPANLHGVRNGLTRLDSADIDNKDGVRRHLEAHLEDGGGGDAADENSALSRIRATLHRRGAPTRGRAPTDRLKLRQGGILSTRSGAKLTTTEQAALDGEPAALRALLRQAVGVNTLDARRLDGLQLRAADNGTGGTRLSFTGYATMIEAPFEMYDWLGSYTEILRGGCFKQTLAMSPDVILCVNHNWDDVPMARTIPGTMRLAEDSTGLLTEADIDPGRADVDIVASAVEGGELDAMSFAFWAVRQTWSPDYDQRDIHEVDIDQGDTSIVTHPAHPGTAGTIGLRARQAVALAGTRVPGLIVARARAERRQSDVLLPTTAAVLTAVLDLALVADTAMDYAVPMLAELLGLPDPDTDDGEGAGGDVDGDGDAGTGMGTGMSLSRMRLREDAYRARG